MKTIVIDHIRRWWWLWLFSCVGCGWIVGFGRPLKPDLSNAWFPVAMYLGVVQLSQDLQRGDVLHVLRAMPVSAKQIGRAWWWASVGVPALALTLIVGLVFTLSPFYSRHPLSLVAGFNYWLSNGLLFGPLFLFFGEMPVPGSFKGWQAQIRGTLFSLLFTATVFGMIYFYRLFPPATLHWKIFVVAASALTIASWFRAESFAWDRLETRIRPRNLARKALSSMSGTIATQARCMNGGGGLWFLFKTIFSRMVWMGLFMVLIMTLAMTLIQRLTGDLARDKAMPGLTLVILVTQISFWLICWQMVRAGLHLRFLRSLPVSTTKLAALFILAPLAAMLVVVITANLAFAISISNVPFSPVAILSESSLLQIALGLLLVPLIVWRGFDLFGFLIVMLVAMGGPVSSMFAKKFFPLTTSVAVSVFFIFVWFLVTQLLLERSSTTYRPRRNQFGGRQFGLGS